MTPADVLPLAVLVSVWVVAAWLDVRYRRVPNWLCATSAIAGLLLGLIAGGLPALGSQALHMAIALVGGMVLFRFRVFGGGDAKLYAGVAAWFAMSKAVLLLVAVAFCGAILLILWFAYRRFRRLPIGRSASGTDFDSLPYGIAIGAGAVLTMGLQI